MWSGWLRGSIYWVLLVWGRFCVWETIIPEAQEHFLTPLARRDTHPFGGLGLSRRRRTSKKRCPSRLVGRGNVL